MDKQTEYCTCPECGARLEVVTSYVRKVQQKQYFTVLTTCGEYQVLRMYLLFVEMEKGCKADWKSHATLTLLAKQDCPLWLQYD